MDLPPDASSTAPIHMAAVGDTPYFVTNDGASGNELWKTQGTVASTVLVRDIRPGAVGADPSDFANVNGTLYFQANNGTSGSELWKSDGTAGARCRSRICDQARPDRFPAG